MPTPDAAWIRGVVLFIHYAFDCIPAPLAPMI
jgi:hypothetical protein